MLMDREIKWRFLRGEVIFRCNSIDFVFKVTTEFNEMHWWWCTRWNDIKS